MPVETEVQQSVNNEYVTKSELETLKNRVYAVEREQDRQSGKIESIEKQLGKIEENTTWIKRTITAALITATCTALIGGAVAIFYNLLQK